MQRNAMLCFGVDLISDDEKTADLIPLLKKKSDDLKRKAEEIGCKLVQNNLNFGFTSFYSFIVRYIKQTYQSSCSAIKSLSRNTLKMVDLFISTLNRRLALFTEQNLRSTADGFITNFGTGVHSLLDGVDGLNVTGETALAEREHVGQWLDEENEPIPFESDHDIDLLYGKKQFQRLIDEFLLVCKNTKIAKFSSDELSTILGLTPLFNPDQSTVNKKALLLAKKALVNQLLPIALQLNERGKYLMQKVCQHSLSLLEPKEQQDQKALNTGAIRGSSTLNNIFSLQKEAPSTISTQQNEKSALVGALLQKQENDEKSIVKYPYFASWISESFDNIISDISKEFEKKVKDEFECVLISSEKSEKKKSKSINSLIFDSAKAIFDENKGCIANNIAHKFFECYLVAYEKQLNDFQNIDLAQEQINELFEAEANQKRLQGYLESVQELQQKLRTNETELNKSIDLFIA